MVNNNITMYHGDTYTQSIYINSGSFEEPERYIITEHDKLYIGIREPNQRFEDSLIRKVYSSSSEKTAEGDIVFKLDYKDTKLVHPGTYYLCAKLVQNYDSDSPIVSTIIDDTLFFIL